MAVKIKLKRLGKIREPYYRIIVADAHNKRDGRAIEEIGKYGPKEEPSYIEVKSDRAQHWLSVGAQPTGPVRAIFEKTGDWQLFKGLPLPKPLRVPETAPDKKTVFEAAAKEAAEEQERSSASRGGKKAGRSDRRRSTGEDDTQGTTESESEQGSAQAADSGGTTSAEAPSPPGEG